MWFALWQLQFTNCTPAITSTSMPIALHLGLPILSQVVLTSENAANSTAFTDSNGTFSFPVDSTTLINATVTILMNSSSPSNIVVANGTVYNCTDSATNQAPQFTVAARVPTNGESTLLHLFSRLICSKVACYLGSALSAFAASFGNSAYALPAWQQMPRYMSFDVSCVAIGIASCE